MFHCCLIRTSVLHEEIQIPPRTIGKADAQHLLFALFAELEVFLQQPFVQWCEELCTQRPLCTQRRLKYIVLVLRCDRASANILVWKLFAALALLLKRKGVLLFVLGPLLYAYDFKREH